jgi:hypothetical protein
VGVRAQALAHFSPVSSRAQFFTIRSSAQPNLDALTLLFWYSSSQMCPHSRFILGPPLLSPKPKEYNPDEDPILQDWLVHLDTMNKTVDEVVDEVFSNIVEIVLKED